MQPEPFKTCTSCGHVWPSLEVFLSDPKIVLAGYQPHFDDLTAGLFIFTHLKETCGTSMAIPVHQFIELSNRPILSARTREPEGCPNLCMRKGCFDPCPVECECNWVRDVLSRIEKWSKKAA